MTLERPAPFMERELIALARTMIQESRGAIARGDYILVSGPEDRRGSWLT